MLLHNGCAHGVHNSVCPLYLLCSYAVHIDFKVSHEPEKIRLRRQLTQEGIIHHPAFQKFNHIITQMQVSKIGVCVIFRFRTPQQIINGYFIKLFQLDNGLVTDILKLVPPHSCLTQTWRDGFSPQIQRQATFHTQVFQKFLYG